MASPVKFAHVVLRTARFDELKQWWLTVLQADVRHGNDFLAFISYDDEHHRMAIVKMPHLDDQDATRAGVEHFAYTMANIDDLFDHYTRLKDEHGIEPYWTINHGMTLSAYYCDPDGNQAEFQIDICSLEEADEFMHGPLFAANPIGVDVDFDDLIERHLGGESFESITAYVPAGAT
jgi:catechol-2,3-dioxygenase